MTIVECMACGADLPIDAVDECPSCGFEIDEDAARQLETARAVRTVLATNPPATTNATAGHYSFAEAAKLLHLDRVKTIPRLVEAGVLRAVPWGEHERRIIGADVERALREGLPTIPGRTRRPPTIERRPESSTSARRGRRTSRRSTNVADAIRRIPLDG